AAPRRLAAGEAAPHGCSRGQDEAGEEDLLAAAEVTYPPREQQEAAERHQVSVYHPREAALRKVQVVLDRGQRDVHDRRVEHHHQLAEAQHGERYPAATLAAARELDRGRRDLCVGVTRLRRV